ncbi:MAG: LacI family DNA-binding transcriptional regulator [Pseudomonadota bacterium]
MSATSFASARRATISDVAETAGVSVKTVSRVLNDAPNVKLATRERVQHAIDALGYRPNSPARMLAGRRTYLIGLIYNGVSSYITSIQQGVLAACRPAHYDLLIYPCDYTDPALIDHIRDFVEGPRVDGLILVPPVGDVASVCDFLNEIAIPNVAISRDPDNDADISVSTNDREISRRMVQHLARLGHERIAFVCGHPDHKAMARRYLGYLDGLRDNELTVDEGIVFQGENTYESGIDCGIRLMRLKERPTAVFCANDHMAAGVMTVAHDRRLSIPDDLSVAGFDNSPLAGQVWPRLTTIDQPLEDMAKIAAEKLLGLVRGEAPSAGHHVVDAELIVRKSTGPAPTDDG